MSHSYKKNPFYTDGNSPTTKQMKSIANRCVRRREKQIVHGWYYEDVRYLDEKVFDKKSYKKYFCSYDIHDYVSYWSKNKAMHDYEHPRWICFSGEWWHPWEEYTKKQFMNYWEKYYRRK